MLKKMQHNVLVNFVPQGEKYIQALVVTNTEYLQYLRDSPALVVELTKLALYAKEHKDTDAGFTAAKVVKKSRNAFLVSSKQFSKVSKHISSTKEDLIKILIKEHLRPTDYLKVVKVAFDLIKSVTRNGQTNIVLNKFKAVMELIDEAMEATLESDVNGELLQQLQHFRDHWTHIMIFVAKVHSYFAKSVELSPGCVRNIADFGAEISRVSGMGLVITSLANSFLGIYKKHLEPAINQLQHPVTDAIASLSNESQATSQAIAHMIEASATELAEEIRRVFTQLRMYNETNEDESLQGELLHHTLAQDVADKQEELEVLLTAAPASVALLSHLCIASATTVDFQLCVPVAGFKFVKSGWFRGCLHQVVNSGAACFTLANKNIARIETHTKHIPDTVLQILHLLVEGTPADIQSVLPDMLAETTDKMDQCSAAATEVEEAFESLVNVINEVTQTFTATRSERESKHTSANISAPSSSKPLEELEGNFNEIRNVLLEGLKALIKVRQQWSQLVRVFNQFARIIKLEMVEPFEIFKQRAEKKTVKIGQGSKLSQFAKETFRDKAQEIAQKGVQVNMLSAMFLRVSDKHLKAPLLSMDELLALTAYDKEHAKGILQDISTKCDQSQLEIAQEAKQSHKGVYDQFREELEVIAAKAAPGKIGLMHVARLALFSSSE